MGLRGYCPLALSEVEHGVAVWDQLVHACAERASLRTRVLTGCARLVEAQEALLSTSLVLSAARDRPYEDGENMPAKPENRPTIELRLVVVHRPHNGSAVARIQVQTRQAEWATLFMQEWPTGRPTATQADLLCESLEQEGLASILASVGTQGVLT